MISFIIPARFNSKGLLDTIATLHGKCGVDHEIFVTIAKSDRSISALMNIAVDNGCQFVLFDTENPITQVNLTAPLCKGYCLSVIYDNLSANLPSNFGMRVEAILAEDPMAFIYLDENHFSFPILSRMAYELLGYYYNPMFHLPYSSDRFVGHIANLLAKVYPIEDSEVSQEYGKFLVDSELMTQDELTFKHTAGVRKVIADSFIPFMEDKDGN